MVPAGQTAHGSASAQFWAVAGGLNTSVCRLDVHVGSGVLQHRRNPDDELNNLLRVHDLCLLNTWGSARAGHCATFCNGSILSQIDFVATRRTITDVHARTAKPLDIDLAPGPKHKPEPGSSGALLAPRPHPIPSLLIEPALVLTRTSGPSLALLSVRLWQPKWACLLWRN